MFVVAIGFSYHYTLVVFLLNDLSQKDSHIYNYEVCFTFMFLIHQGMEKLKASGKAKSIGVSNFNEEQLKDLLSSCQVKPAMNQVMT